MCVCLCVCVCVWVCFVYTYTVWGFLQLDAYFDPISGWRHSAEVGSAADVCSLNVQSQLKPQLSYCWYWHFPRALGSLPQTLLLSAWMLEHASERQLKRHGAVAQSEHVHPKLQKYSPNCQGTITQKYSQNSSCNYYLYRASFIILH